MAQLEPIVQLEAYYFFLLLLFLNDYLFIYLF